jgi:hypothetical protein
LFWIADWHGRAGWYRDWCWWRFSQGRTLANPDFDKNWQSWTASFFIDLFFQILKRRTLIQLQQICPRVTGMDGCE